MILLNVDKNKWIEAVRVIQEEYGIREGTKKDETSARRIAILLGELYLSEFREGSSKAISNVTIVEKDAFDLAAEYRLSCDVLDREERVKPHLRRQVLCTWGLDKPSGVEGFTSQLKEWTAEALFGNFETNEKEENYGTGREIDLGSGALETFGLDEAGIG
jgi:hypothetical protein